MGGGDNQDLTRQAFRTGDGGLSWAQVNLPVSDDGEALSDMSWVSATKGYALYASMLGAGNEYKTLYYTNDAGRTWSLRSRSGNPLTENTIKAVGNLTAGGYCAGIKFFGNGIGFIGMARGGIYRSADGGVDFKAVIFDGVNAYPVPDMLSSEEGYADMKDVLYHTANGGATWSEIISSGDIAAFLKQ